jgi:hypothetical protein
MSNPAGIEDKHTIINNYQDGLTDLLLGLILMVLGAAPVLEFFKPLSGLWEMLLFLIAFILYLSGVYFIKLPRFANLNLQSRKRGHFSTLLIYIFIFLILGLVTAQYFASHLHFRAARNVTLLWLTPALWVFLFGVSLCLLAYYLNVNRFYLYAFFYAISNPTQFGLRLNRVPLALTYNGYYIPALVIIVIGSVYLLRFIHRAPLPGLKAVDK